MWNVKLFLGVNAKNKPTGVKTSKLHITSIFILYVTALFLESRYLSHSDNIFKGRLHLYECLFLLVYLKKKCFLEQI